MKLELLSIEHNTPEWLDFEAFYDWAIANGYQEGLEIDRIDNEGEENEVEIDGVDEKGNAVISFVGGTSIRSVSIDELR